MCDHSNKIGKQQLVGQTAQEWTLSTCASFWILDSESLNWTTPWWVLNQAKKISLISKAWKRNQPRQSHLTGFPSFLPFSSLRKPATSLSRCLDQGSPWSPSAWCQNDAGRAEQPMLEGNWRGWRRPWEENTSRRRGGAGNQAKWQERTKAVWRNLLPSVLLMLWSIAQTDKQQRID